MLRWEHSFVHPTKCVWRDNPYLHAVIQIHYTMRIGQLKIITSVSALEHLTWWESATQRKRERICALLKMKATESDTMMWRVLLQLCWNAWKIQCTLSSSNTCSRCEPLTHARSGCRSADLLHSYSRGDEPSRCGPNFAPMAGVLGIPEADRRWNRHLVSHNPLHGFQICLLHTNASEFDVVRGDKDPTVFKLRFPEFVIYFSENMHRVLSV